MITAYRRIGALFIRHFYAILGPFELINIFYWQLFDIIIFGFLAQSMVGGGLSQQLILTKLALFYFVARTTIGAAFALFRDLIDSSFTGIMATPIRNWQLLSALFLLGVFDSIVSVSVASGAMYIFFGVSVLKLSWWLLPIIGLLIWSGIILGTLVLAFLVTFGKKASVIFVMSWLIVPISGVFYPVEIMPYAVQVLASGVPVYHVMHAIRCVLGAQAGAGHALVMATILNSIYFLLALFIFDRALARRKAIGLPRLEGEA